MQNPQEHFNVTPEKWGKHLSDLMISMGYKVPYGGCCFGVAGAVAEANLSGPKSVEQLKQSLTFLSHSNAKTLSRDKQGLSADDLAKLNNALALLDTIAIYFDAIDYREIFAAGTTLHDQGHNLIATNKMFAENKKSRMVDVYDSINVFDKKNLEESIERMFEGVEKLNSHGEMIPVSILVGNQNHEISCHYNAGKKLWMAIDTNQLNRDGTHPMIETKDPQEIASFVWLGLKSRIGINNDRAPIRFVALSKAEDRNTVFNAFQTWNQTTQLNENTIKGIPPSDLKFLLAFCARDGLKDAANVIMRHINTYPKVKAAIDMNAQEVNAPLVFASLRGHVDLVKMLLENGADPAVRGLENNSSWQSAINENQLDVIDALIRFTPGKLNLDQLNLSPPLLTFCAQHGRKDIVEKLLEFVRKGELNINEVTAAGSALHKAAANGHTHIVEMLLTNGADPNIKDVNGNTAFDIARNKALESNPESKDRKVFGDIMKMIAKNASPDINKNASERSVHFSAMGVEGLDRHGNTALFNAVENKNIDSISELVLKGANVNFINRDGVSIVDLLESRYNFDHDLRLQVYDLVLPKLTFDSDAQALSDILYSSVKNKDNAFSESLLQKCDKSVLDVVHANGYNVLHMAIFTQDSAMVKRLLRTDINVNAQTEAGNTPLMMVLIMGSSRIKEPRLSSKEVHELVKECLSRHPDLSLENKKGETAATLIKELYPHDAQLAMMVNCHDKKSKDSDQPHLDDASVKPKLR